MITITKDSHPSIHQLMLSVDLSNGIPLPGNLSTATYDVLDEYKDFLPEIEKELKLLTRPHIVMLAEGGPNSELIADRDPMLAIAHNMIADYHGGSEE